VGGFSALTGNLALFGAIHRCKSTIFLGHVVLPPSPGLSSCSPPRLFELSSPTECNRGATTVAVRDRKLLIGRGL
jgi:hypothetical protein